MKIFSYVVEHDFGNEPNPYGGICTLCRCKYSEKLEEGKKGRKNIVELAEKGDWIIGTGGANLGRSAGHGRLIYVMQVDETPNGAVCISDSRLKDRMPIAPLTGYQKAKHFALISNSEHFYYFGSRPFDGNSVDISGFDLEKRGPGFRYIDPDHFALFLKWLKGKWQPGRHGEPRGSVVDWENGGVKCRSCC